ncbi:MAG: hypothetical protein ACKV2U_24035 [Bryobacteraceae bacterium]
MPDPTIQSALLATTQIQRLYISPDLEVNVRPAQPDIRGHFIEIRARNERTIVVKEDIANRPGFRGSSGEIGPHKAVFFVSVPPADQPLGRPTTEDGE